MSSIDPKIWGTAGWKFITATIFAYPNNPTNDEKMGYSSFFSSLQYVLPCERCRINYSRHLSHYPLTNEILKSQTSLLNWYLGLRNISNYETGKGAITFNDLLIELWDNDDKRNNSSFLIFSSIILLIVLLTIYKYNYNCSSRIISF